MNLHLWLAFAAASFVVGAIPGPGVASIVGFAFISDRGTALASVAGMAVRNATAISVSLGAAGAILAFSSCVSDPRCLVPAFDGALSMQEWKDGLWDGFYTGAPAIGVVS